MFRLTTLVAVLGGVAIASDDIPPPRPVDVAALVKQLGSDDFHEREAATLRLSALNVDEVPPELLAALKSENPEVRDRAAKALKALREHIALRPLPRGERFARRGQVDLYVASNAVSDPLGYITFFELPTAGVEVKATDGAVSVAKVAEGKPFAAAGVKVGDVVAEVNSKKSDSAESLRRLLRDALALGDATVTLKRGDKTETVKVSLPE